MESRANTSAFTRLALRLLLCFLITVSQGTIMMNTQWTGGNIAGLLTCVWCKSPWWFSWFTVIRKSEIKVWKETKTTKKRWMRKPKKKKKKNYVNESGREEGGNEERQKKCTQGCCHHVSVLFSFSLCPSLSLWSVVCRLHVARTVVGFNRFTWIPARL